MKYTIHALILILLTGCASTPKFDTKNVDQSLTPQSVNAEPAIAKGKTALWGGTILYTQNLKDYTQIEVLAYPLSSYHQPQVQDKPLGRFIIRHQGFLEPATYAQGKLITVMGIIGDSKKGKVGDSTYIYPVLNSQQLHLWSPTNADPETSFHFGIGIRL